ncbi:MAG: nitroreductase family protein, partial [Ruminococcus sp.]|nr:nitroreductase family protein [Ruminococcus sp.]
MFMNTIEAINKRRSYRGKYKQINIPKKDIITIMECGLNAPSGCNKQTTS